MTTASATSTETASPRRSCVHWRVRRAVLLALSAALAPQLLSAQEQDAAGENEIVEVVIRGENIPEPMARTAEISAFIMPADLQRQGDDTAAAALRRVTGLSLNEGKFVYVRGLGERYSAALLNGSPLPSPEPMRRVVPLDLFPNSLLSSVVVQKTYSAKYPGEFGGGVIDMKTVTVPDEPFFSFSFGTGGNTETTFGEALTYYGGDWDLLGFDNGVRSMPGPLREALATGNRLDAGSFSEEELQRIGRSLANAPLNLIQRTDRLQPDFSGELTGGYSVETGWGSLGVIAVAGFDNSWQTRTGRQQMDGLIEDGVISPRTDYAFTSTQNDAVLNGLLGFGAEWEDHSVSLTNLYVHSTTKEARSRSGFSERTGATVREDYTEWFERALFSSQLAGSHEFGDLSVEWRGAYARTSRDAPYEKGIRYRLVNGEWLHNASQEQNYTRFSNVHDEVVSGGLDFAYSLAVPGRKDAVISAGLAWSDNDRSAEMREFRFLALDGALPLDVQRQRVDFLLSDYNIRPGMLSLRETTGTSGAAAYDGALEVMGTYVQLDAEPLPLVRASVGLRYEDAEQSVTVRELLNTGSGSPPLTAEPIRNHYFLPAATVTWNFYEDMQLRFGFSKTIGRPQFRELAPQQYLDPDSDRLFVGNPWLRDTKMLNLDARYEWYFDQGEYFTVGLFYKDLDKPIEATVNEAGSTVMQTYLNAPRAVLYGAELEVRKYFSPPIRAAWWGENRLFVAANYTYTSSEVKVKEGDVVFPLSGQGQERTAREFVRDGSPLQGQSDHLANLQLGIENEGTRTQVTLLASYASKRISARARAVEPDFVQEPGTIVDLVVRKGLDLFGHDLTLGFEARNIFGEDFEEYQELGGGRVDINRYELGTSLSVSLTMRF